MESRLGSTWAGFPRRHPVWASLAAVLIVLVLVLAFFNWNWVKGPVQRMVSNATGREFRIDGNLDVDYFPLEVHAENLFLANAGWSEEKAMARAERMDMKLRFWPLLRGRVTIPYLIADQPFIRLENNGKEANWMFGHPPDCQPDCEQRVRVQRLRVHAGRMEFREPLLKTSVDMQFESARPPQPDALAPLILSGKGTYRDAPFELKGQVDSPVELQDKPLPYSIDLTASAGSTQAHVSGTLAEPLQTENITVDFEMHGPDLARLYDYVGIVLPKTPPYALKGKLSRRGSRLSYQSFSGTVGDSDLGGDASFDFGGDRPKLTAVLKSKRIDFNDLAGFIGGTPGTGEGETASAEQKKEASAQKASGKLLPSRRLELEKMRTMDADVQLTAAQVNSKRLPLEDMRAHLKLDNGQLTLDPLEFGAAGGRLRNAVHLDARQDQARFAMDMKIQKLQLQKLFPKAKVMQDSLGSLNGIIELKGHGDSAASILASSNGHFSAIMGQGRMSNLVLEIAGLDIAEALKFLIGKDKEVRMRCAYADFSIADGLATAQSVAIDTTDTALLLRGQFSFKDEKLDMTLLPKPKDKSPISIRVPINIGGTFAHPSIAPKGGPLILKGAAVAALTAIAPPLALLGLIETGPGKDTACGPGVPPTEKQAPEGHKSKDPSPALKPGPKPAP
jgi:uncharacterized protein involved in outer membrane biogenesis